LRWAIARAIYTDVANVVPKLFFAGYGFAALGTAIGDTLFPSRIAAQTSWGLAPGWLREIACFDVFLVVLCAIAFGQVGKTQLPRALAGCLALLSVLIGSNNLAAFIENGGSLHLQGAIVHGIAAIVGLAAMRRLAMVPLA
jgi:hypothetical protein